MNHSRASLIGFLFNLTTYFSPFAVLLSFMHKKFLQSVHHFDRCAFRHFFKYYIFLCHLHVLYIDFYHIKSRAVISISKIADGIRIFLFSLRYSISYKIVKEIFWYNCRHSICGILFHFVLLDIADARFLRPQGSPLDVFDRNHFHIFFYRDLVEKYC